MSEGHSGGFGGRLLIGASGSAAVAMLPVYVSALRGTVPSVTRTACPMTALERPRLDAAVKAAGTVLEVSPPLPAAERA